MYKKALIIDACATTALQGLCFSVSGRLCQLNFKPSSKPHLATHCWGLFFVPVWCHPIILRNQAAGAGSRGGQGGDGAALCSSGVISFCPPSP